MGYGTHKVLTFSTRTAALRPYMCFEILVGQGRFRLVQDNGLVSPIKML